MTDYFQLEEKNIIDTCSDLFYKRIYLYYINKGYYPSLFKYLSEIVFGFVQLSLFFIMTLVINWYDIFRGNLQLVFPNTDNKIWQGIIFITATFYLLVWLWDCKCNLSEIYSLSKSHRYYIEKLNISDEDLRYMKWNDIVNKFDAKSSLEITQRITREDNYMIYIMDNLDWKNSENFINIIHKLFVNNIVVNGKLNKEYLDPTILKFFTIVFIIWFFFSIPFRLLYHLILFILRNIEKIYSDKDLQVSRKRFFPYSFKLYNELYHLYLIRINKSNNLFGKWSDNNPNLLFEYIIHLFINIISLVMSMLLLILFFSSIQNETNTLIIWYIAFVGTGLYFIRKHLQTIKSTIIFSHHKIYNKLRKYIYSKEDNIDAFFKNINERHVYNIITDFYTLIDIILTPFKLVYFYNNINKIIFEINNISFKHENVGIICKYSNFENIENLVYIDQALLSASFSCPDRFYHSMILYTRRNMKWFENIKINIERNNGIITSNSILVDRNNMNESLSEVSGILNVSINR
jgi:hypothetical protein